MVSAPTRIANNVVVATGRASHARSRPAALRNNGGVAAVANVANVGRVHKRPKSRARQSRRRLPLLSSRGRRAIAPRRRRR